MLSYSNTKVMKVSDIFDSKLRALRVLCGEDNIFSSAEFAEARVRRSMKVSLCAKSKRR